MSYLTDLWSDLQTAWTLFRIQRTNRKTLWLQQHTREVRARTTALRAMTIMGSVQETAQTVSPAHTATRGGN